MRMTDVHDITNGEIDHLLDICPVTEGLTMTAREWITVLPPESWGWESCGCPASIRKCIASMRSNPNMTPCGDRAILRMQLWEQKERRLASDCAALRQSIL